MLIGTHNSASYSFDFNISFWNKRTKWEWLRLAAKHFPSVRERIISLSKTQRQDITTQLEAGVRILDVRVSRAPSDGAFYTSHTFCSAPLDAILGQILSFLESGRVDSDDGHIVLALSPDFENQGTLVGHEAALLDKVVGAFKHVPYKIRLVYKPLQISLDYYGSVSNMDTLTNYYYDVSTVADFKERFGATEFGDESVLHCVLTPPSKLKELWGVSLESYASELNPAVAYLLREREAEGRELPEACIFDFFDTGLGL